MAAAHPNELVITKQAATPSDRRRWLGPVATVLWLAAAVAAAAWHFGPGRDLAARSLSYESTVPAEIAMQQADWNAAVDGYLEALAALPPDAVEERRRLTLAHARARIQIGELVEAQDQLAELITELQDDGGAETDELLTSARHEAATASYFAAWLMRREGAIADEWKVETNYARQQFHLLAEEAVATDDAAGAATFQRNLEAVVKLEQMDESELLAKPLPKKCPGCCKNLSQRKRQQCQSRCQSEQGKQNSEQRQDARQEVKRQRGAGLNSSFNQGS